MKKTFAARVLVLADTVFDRPLSPVYWLWVICCLIIGFMLLQPTSHLPDLGKDLAIGGVMLGLARLFNSPLGRWAWAAFMGLLLVTVMLDVAILAQR